MSRNLEKKYKKLLNIFSNHKFHKNYIDLLKSKHMNSDII